MLPLTFADPDGYDGIALGDRVTLVGVEEAEMMPGKQVELRAGADAGWEYLGGEVESQL